MDEMKKSISVETEHIFPIIKKWLYSEKEIFLREIVSNAVDAITKLKRLSSLGEVHGLDEEAYRVTVTVDKESGTLTVSDNGIGMTEEELQRYICQIALSGALDFISKYETVDGKEAKEDTANSTGIIGHFGLGFYSSFMISDTVEIETKSFTGAPAVHWSCEENGEYTVSEGVRETRGTDVIMHVTEEEKEYLDESKIREILERYCSFMPVEIYLENIGAEETEDGCTCGHEEGEPCTCGHDHAEENGEEKEKNEPKPINDTNPLWLRQASGCTEEEYRAFYGKLFKDYREPLFWIHINADYPLNFKGILYFPKIQTEFDSLEGQVKLYYNQVFVADNIKEVIPEYMLMLKGVLDCPELPLNVSRSYLQNSGYVAKISAHITKKICDKLNSIFNLEREKYEKLWPDIKLFVEYACMRDQKFYDRVKKVLMLPLEDGTFKTVDEYLETAKEKHENIIYYTTDKVAQAQYVSMFRAQGIEVAVFDKLIDTQYMGVVENDRSVRFVRVDAEVAQALKGDGEAYKNEELEKLFREVSGNDKLTVSFENLKDAEVPAILTISEQSRRFEDMMKMYRMSGGDDGGYQMPTDATLILNASNETIRRLGELTGEERAKRTAKQIYTLALLSQRQLTAEELRSFLSDSFAMLKKELD